MSQKRKHEEMNNSHQKKILIAGGAGFIGMFFFRFSNAFFSMCIFNFVDYQN
jgi:hypothetical protein